MAEKEKLISAEQRKKMAEELWLDYFNRTLYENGLITEQARNRMMCLISRRSSTAGKTNRKEENPGRRMEL